MQRNSRPYFRIGKKGDLYFVTRSIEDTARTAFEFSSNNRSKCVEYIGQFRPALEWELFLRYSFDHWSLEGDEPVQNEFFPTVSRSVERFKALRLEVDADPQRFTKAQCPLTLGVHALNGRIEVDLIRYADGTIYLVDDFTWISDINTDPAALHILQQITKQIPVERIRVFEKTRERICRLKSDIPFSQWTNDFFSDAATLNEEY